MDDTNNRQSVGKRYTVGEFARLTGVTERTLRFYDRKGLLKPSDRNAQGHRIYTDGDLLQLQKIITLKYLDFSLDEIDVHLRDSEQGLKGTLDMQFELLKRKREQLDQVLATMERMRSIAGGVEHMDNALLLMFIHNIHNEQAQKEALSRYLPNHYVSALFMDHLPTEERLELERRMATILAELFEFYREGRSTDDVAVLESGRGLLELLRNMLGAGWDAIEDGEEMQLEAWANPALDQDPVISQIRFSEGEERYMAEVMVKLNAIDVLTKGGNGDGS